MPDRDETADKTHYICQTYIEKVGARGVKAGLKIGKQLRYPTQSEAQDRADREFQSKDCVGADAYMVTEDSGSGEVSEPTFIVRLGVVPEDDSF